MGLPPVATDAWPTKTYIPTAANAMTKPPAVLRSPVEPLLTPR